MVSMVHHARIACLAFLLLLTGCAGKNHTNTDMKANLEPELWDTSIILKDLKRGRPLTEQEKKALASRGSIQFNLDVKETEEVQELLQYFTLDKRGSMAFAQNVGGPPELTAVCVIATGVLGATFGSLLLHVLPLRTAFARGAMLGMQHIWMEK